MLRKPKYFIKYFSYIYLKRVYVNNNKEDERFDINPLCRNCLYLKDNDYCIVNTTTNRLYNLCNHLTPSDYSGNYIYIYAEKEKTIQ